MKTEQPILITSVVAAADLSNSKNLLIGFNGNICGSSAKPLGVLTAGSPLGEESAVIARGIALVYSGAAVSAGAKLQSNASGKVVNFLSGEVAGYAVDAASGADELIRVLLS